jgi:hypothetical protein
MGTQISSLLIQPAVGLLIVTLAVFAIMKENEKSTTTARWLAISDVVLTILLIGIIFFVSVVAA